MSSTQKKVIFVYIDKLIEIFCSGEEKIEEVIKKSIDKLSPDSKIHDYNFYYEGRIIDPKTYERPIEYIDYFGKKESFFITVEKKIKIIKCPKCIYNDCVVSLINYKATFYNCKYKHLEMNSYNNYFNNQIYLERITCANSCCCKNAKIDPNFFLCLTCSKLLKRNKYLCSECIRKHNHELKDEQKHFIINYEDQNYFCRNHLKKWKIIVFNVKKIYVMIVWKST